MKIGLKSCSADRPLHSSLVGSGVRCSLRKSTTIFHVSSYYAPWS